MTEPKTHFKFNNCQFFGPRGTIMDQRERNELDRHITGNYGEDQFKEIFMGLQEVDKLQQRLVSFCNQLAKDEDDPVREQIVELCRLAKVGVLEELSKQP